MTIAERLGRMLRARGPSASEVARRAGMGRQQAWHILSGANRDPKLSTLERLVTAMGGTLAELFAEAGPEADRSPSTPVTTKSPMSTPVTTSSGEEPSTLMAMSTPVTTQRPEAEGSGAGPSTPVTTGEAKPARAKGPADPLANEVRRLRAAGKTVNEIARTTRAEVARVRAILARSPVGAESP